MITLRLQRLTQTEFATYGLLTDEENRELVKTLELPWKHNAHGISCIPPGEYVAYRRKSPKRGYQLFGLLAVPGRSDIEIHVGNTVADSSGCILVGTRLGMVGDQHGILESHRAFDALMLHLKGVDRFTLDVRNPLPLEAV